MTFVMVKHKVKDYRQWKTIFDQDEQSLRQAGCQRFGLYRDQTDPNEVIVFCEWSNPDDAKKFFQSDRLKQAMQRGGVLGHVEIDYLDMADKKTLRQAEPGKRVA